MIKNQGDQILKELRAQGAELKVHRKLFEKIDQKFERVIVAVVQNQQTLKTLITRDEFNDFKDTVLTRFDEMAGNYETLDEELKAFGEQQDRNTKAIKQLQAA